MLLNLINDLLDLAKEEKQTFEFNVQYFDLEESIEASFKTLQFLAVKKNINLKLSICEKERKYFKRVLGDVERFE